MIPFPRFRIDRLADGAEQSNTLARGFLDGLIAGLHQRADRGRRGVEDVDLVLVDDVPEPRIIGIIRYAFEHQRGRAVRQRPIHNVAVAGDPADVGGAPEDITIVIVEYVLMGHRCEHQIAARSVQHALGLAGRSRSIEDEQRILRVHVLARAFRRHHPGGVVIPKVARGLHVDGCTRAFDDDDPVDVAGLGKRGIDIGLQRHLLATAQALVGGDDYLGIAVVDALGKTVRREAGEGGFRNHRKVDRDAVALLDVAGAQDVGESADLVMQLPIGDVL